MASKRPNQPGPPKRVPSTPVPPTARKEAIPLQPGPSGSSTKFYNGPTVSKTDSIPDYSRDVAKKTVTSAKVGPSASDQEFSADTQVQTRKAVAVARRHPWSIASLITTLPFLLFISLFSTVVCPPPNSQSTISKYLLSPLGLSHPPQSGSLHQSLCYPANAYHDAVLEPYVYPLIDRAQDRVTSHPAYVKGIEPAYTRARDTSAKVWNGPVAPVVRRVQREVKRAYLTFVQPHIPFVKAKIHTITAPYTSRAAALHKQYLHPQLAAAQLYATSAKDQSVNSYNYVASHPITGQAGKYANLGYQQGRKRSIEAYNYSRPHVIRGAQEAERIAREILGPRVVKGLQVGSQHAAKGYNVIKSRVVALYYAHLDPYVGPHLRRASTTLAPHAEMFNQRVYRPFIRPSLEAVLPAFLFTPEPPKTFWAMISDFLPSAGMHAAERKGSMDQGYSRAKADIKTKTASVKSAVSSASASASPSPAYSANTKVASGKKDKMTRAEMDKTRDQLKQRIEEQGKKGYKQVKSELVAMNRDILNTKFPMLQQGSRAEIEQDINYVVTGLDKLYSKSPVLKKEQVLKSSQQADVKVQSKVQKIKTKLESLKKDWHDQGRPIVRKALQPLDELLAEKEVLAEDMAWVDDVSPKDWTKFNALQTSVDGWKDKYMGLHNGTVRDKALQDPSANVNKNLADLFTEIDDVVEGFRARVGILKRTALDRVEAREALASESSSTASRSASSSPSPVAAAAASDRVSILPIAERAAEAIGAAGIIGKGKEQVEDALRQAAQAVTATPSSVSASSSDRVSILPIAERAAEAVGVAGVIGKGKQQVEGALRQAGQAVTASPSSATAAASDRVAILPIAERAAEAGGAAGVIGKGRQQVEDALHQASQAIAGSPPSATGAVQQAQSVVSDLVSSASSVVHDATRSAVSAAGYTPSPEGVSEHAASVYSDASASIASVVSAIPNAAGAEAYLESIAAQVQAGAAAAYAQAQEGVYQASRSIVSAAGGTPSPDSAGEYAASVAEQARLSASSVGQAVSSAVHEATRSIISAAGGTPSPEGIAEYASAASASASSVVAEATRAIANAIPSIDLSAASASAASVGSVVSQAVHDGTRAAVKAVGATPSPESAGEHLESVYDQASKSASSLGDVIASAVHDGTRSASKAVGVTPSPESINEHLESVYAQAASSVSSVGSAVSAVPSQAGVAAKSLWDGYASDASSLSSRISSLLAPTATPTGVASYLSSLSSAGASVGQGMLASGQEILASLSSEMHTATRSLAKAAGGTAAPEGLGERVEDIWRKVEEMEGKVEEGVKKALGRDEL